MPKIFTYPGAKSVVICGESVLAWREAEHLVQDVGHHGTARIAVIVPHYPKHFK